MTMNQGSVIFQYQTKEIVSWLFVDESNIDGYVNVKNVRLSTL